MVEYLFDICMILILRCIIESIIKDKEGFREYWYRRDCRWID